MGHEAPPADDPGVWAWSPHGPWDSHVPEVWPKITFSTQPGSEAGDVDTSASE